MLWYKRPTRPAGFSARVRTRKRAVAKKHSAGEALQSDDFEALWRDYKPAFAEAQHGRCGYCESYLLASSSGDVEHFRPKSEIGRLREEPDSWGQELPHSSSVVGRSVHRESEGGYWWLAYDWNNYLLACELCNRKWKRTLFPIEGERSLPLQKGCEKDETPLLLGSFGRERRPWRHFHYSELGQIEASSQIVEQQVLRSARGEATIRTCGLDRESLRQAREEEAEVVYGLLLELDTSSSNEAFEAALRSLQRKGSAKRKSGYPGMVRAIVVRELALTWAQFMRL